MELLRLTSPVEDLGPDPVLIVALDGWTDAAAGGSGAADSLLQLPSRRIGSFPTDELYDYRSRRPHLQIEEGQMGQVIWPELLVDVIEPVSGPALILVHGAEPDRAWQTCASDLLALAHQVGADRYVGLGSVPGPIPHTRPVQLVCTGTDDFAIERLGRFHETVEVPASCQAAWEAIFASMGMSTLGLWARVPHYVAGEYPEASRALLQALSAHLGTPVELSEIESAVAENQAKLDVAARSSDEVSDHVRQLEYLYDAEMEAEQTIGGLTADGAPALREDEVPSAEELGAEIERFLKGRAD